ncbi:glycosyltransferase family 1 protein [Microbacterium sp. BK668]|uniref:glycosyltransferase family 4 protein n=1 Tax=Microbacterium sp. BK668 TaxID=2512118 RepID=UPI00105E164F|nr:glycosyltransferase family 1 protein [Microbacterium sp. BK668]TDN88384.1 glycosyltransferase involved in cell wall biosynthesis [Microbacterium sp. BK668]
MTVRVFVDLLFYTGHRGGTETYAREILKRMPEAFPDAEFVAVTGRAGAERVRGFFPGEVRTARWVGADRVTWAAGEVLRASAYARRLRADVMWCPSNFGPVRTSPVPRVTTTHDVIYHSAGSRGVRGLVPRVTAWLMGRAARTSDAVITVSRAAEKAVVAETGVRPDAITVIGHGTNAPRVPDDPARELEGLGIRPGRALVLSTGNRLPHKNFEGLLRALATMSANRPLVVIPGSHGRDPLLPLVEQLGLQDDVVLPGWVTGAQLEALYASAALYVCPSLTEGFGLPVIDAMRRGCVVLANDVPVLREVGGDVALYADAASPPKLAAAIRTALDDDQSARREAGLRRAAGFTWEDSAARTARVIEATARARGRR